LSWGFNNVAIKLAIHDIPPLIQSSARSVIAAILVGAWTQSRGIPLFKRDGTLRAGILAGILFALEFGRPRRVAFCFSILRRFLS
jgi:drug/metabolite transporter (DMT)-like permease